MAISETILISSERRHIMPVMLAAGYDRTFCLDSYNSLDITHDVLLAAPGRQCKTSLTSTTKEVAGSNSTWQLRIYGDVCTFH